MINIALSREKSIEKTLILKAERLLQMSLQEICIFADDNQWRCYSKQIIDMKGL